jgi:hypothetical protein
MDEIREWSSSWTLPFKVDPRDLAAFIPYAKRERLLDLSQREATKYRSPEALAAVEGLREINLKALIRRTSRRRS